MSNGIRILNVKSEIVCCLGCGRDTAAIGGYCVRCIGHSKISGHELTQIDDRKDRPVLRFGGDPVAWQTEPNKDFYD